MTALLRGLEKALGERLPPTWAVRMEREMGRGPAGRRADALLELVPPSGPIARYVVEFKSRVEPKDVPSVLAQVRAVGGDDSPLVAAPYLSPRTRELLRDEGAAFFDATGNLRVMSDTPALFVEQQGAESDPQPPKRPLRSLKGPAAGRAVRAVCDYRPPYGIRELAERSGTPLATLARVVELLDREALLDREPRGPVTGVDWGGVVRRWVQDYGFTATNRTATFIEPRGLDALLERLRAASMRYAMTGSLAARTGEEVAPARLGALYVDSIEDAAESLGLRRADTGANVVLAEPFDPVVFERTREQDGIVVVNPSQASADLLTGPGRSPAEAEALLAWMKDAEDEWRT